MDDLTEFEKSLFQGFEVVAKKPYLGLILGVLLFFAGLSLYSGGLERGNSGRVFLGGVFLGLSFCEIMESYILFRLFKIFEKMRRKGFYP